ncbi:hypothetical protein EW146_g10088, partial [Bondarzewia mesenterica]
MLLRNDKKTRSFTVGSTRSACSQSGMRLRNNKRLKKYALSKPDAPKPSARAEQARAAYGPQNAMNIIAGPSQTGQGVHLRFIGDLVSTPKPLVRKPIPFASGPGARRVEGPRMPVASQTMNIPGAIFQTRGVLTAQEVEEGIKRAEEQRTVEADAVRKREWERMETEGKFEELAQMRAAHERQQLMAFETMSDLCPTELVEPAVEGSESGTVRGHSDVDMDIDDDASVVLKMEDGADVLMQDSEGAEIRESSPDELAIEQKITGCEQELLGLCSQDDGKVRGSIARHIQGLKDTLTDMRRRQRSRAEAMERKRDQMVLNRRVRLKEKDTGGPSGARLMDPGPSTSHRPMHSWLLLPLLPLLASPLPITALEVPKTHGVPPHLVHRYTSEGSGTWTCLDGSQRIPWTSVNDDYCDCADRSDEPGTGACPDTLFYCKNEGHIGASIPSSRVNDGICEPDCCDGSDEPSSVCENTCKEVGEEYRRRVDAERKLRKTGSKIRSTYVAFAQKEKKRLEGEIKNVEKEIITGEKEVARLKDIADRTESLSAEALEHKKQSPLYASLIAHSNALKSLQREHKKHLEREKSLGE